MTLRGKFSLAFAAVAAVAIATVVLLSYNAMASLIKDDTEQTFRMLIDATTDRASQTALDPADFAAPTDPQGVEYRLTHSRQVLAQAIAPDGTIKARDPDRTAIPVTDRDRELAEHGNPGEQAARNFSLAGEEYRSVTVSLGGGRGAVQIAQRTTETDHLLRQLAQLMIAVGVGVFVLAGLAGRLVAGRVTRRLEKLTGTAEQVSSSGRLDIPVPVEGRDEVARLGGAFDLMLGRLAGARDDQRRLVQDASHELRTPLTSLRTNVSVLRRFDELSPTARQRLIDDLDGETRELAHLVSELVDLAVERQPDEETQPVDLAELAAGVVARARRRTERELRVDAVGIVHGYRDSLRRALSNLVDNALKFSQDSTIELVLRDTSIRVLDRGPGIEPSDVAHIFDRFYRSTSARSMPGSGLGLAIVQQVAVAHGGKGFASNRPDGGAEIGFTLSPSSSL